MDVKQPLEKTLCQLLHEQVITNGKAVALEHDGRVVSYAEVWSVCVNVASAIRNLLTAIGKDGKVCIAIMAYRSIQTVQSIWSILLAGCHYVIIDPDLPIERKLWILRETKAVILIINDIDGNEDEKQTMSVVPTATFESLLNQIKETDNISMQYYLVKNSIKPDDLAYIIFTSGSTGTPEGVCTTHKNIVCRTVGVGCHSIRSGYRVGQICSLSFDVSTFEIYATLLNGGVLVIINNSAIASCSALAAHHLNMVNPPTAIFNTLAKQPEAASFFPALDAVIFAGEKANSKSVQAVTQYASSMLINGYGPTETTHNALCYIITKESSALHSIPIGRPLPNTYMYVVDSHLKLVPIGVSGELLIGGAGVSAGYFNDKKLTAQKFIMNPFISINGPKNQKIVYRTGDIVRMLEDGNIEYQHRVDSQVKIRSQRIELCEIESRLLDLEEISEVVVILRNDIFEEHAADQQHLVAYVVLTKALHSTEDRIRCCLTQWLPHHMVPSFIIILETMPLNSIGKINRKMLPKPAMIKSVRSIVLTILASVLKKQTLLGSANFLQLGGHSLSAMEVMARLYQSFGITRLSVTYFKVSLSTITPTKLNRL
ncbi:unnamed protein product [Didymodactylos carnosus]|uniref:Carrier domain-containing protein n=1 Tax=Didymodactylos carnosus TaxID=1234261 RepID=A0A815KEN9_9BILA|nr:unnamed protein product [Didymodactylos carnosus]CAF1391898.1 unnamed protein product [Didymodactylos carnosus]CAF3853601.1 unnamed protein product [Didymodactylos carnosus]CAF4286402.1 unnamed protein product [Didymodactylos carnosus]